MAYKWQHWLPVGYLRRFTHDPAVNNRKASVWRFDGTSSKLVKAVKECAGNHTYSSSRPAHAETSFHEMENDFPRLIDNVQRGEQLTRREQYQLLLILFDFHLRNVAHDVLSNEERFDAYQRAAWHFACQVCAGVTTDDFQVLCDSMAARWTVVIVTSDTTRFLTSDHPTLLFSAGEDLVSAAMLPVSPSSLLFAFRSDRISQSSSKATVTDVGLLNGLQCKQSIAAIYSDHALTKSEEASAEKWFLKRSHNSSFEDEAFNFSTLPLLADEFSFFELA